MATPLSFTLSYYDGDQLPTPLPAGFTSIAAAVKWCERHNVPTSMVSISECDVKAAKDAYGCYPHVGQCNLDEAHEAGYESLAELN